MSKVRLMSLDVLRGMDMLMIMGVESLVVALAAALGHPEFEHTFGHAVWDGLHFMDLVFPTFLFLAGVSCPFSIAASRARGLGEGALARKFIRRGLMLFLLGMLYNGFLRQLDFAHFRIWSVLGRIGIAWMVAALIALKAQSSRALLTIALGGLAFTMAFTWLVPAPDAAGASVFSAQGNFGCWLDRTLTAGHTYQPMFDPEGFAGILPAIATALFGIVAGRLVQGTADATKAGRLALGGGIAILLGFAITPLSPLNKALWSPSFTLVVAGISSLAFALVYYCVDVKKLQAWGAPFRVIGVNSITIYLLMTVVPFGEVTNFFFGGVAQMVGEPWSQVIVSAGYMAICWGLLFLLDRKQIYFKV